MPATHTPMTRMIMWGTVILRTITAITITATIIIMVTTIITTSIANMTMPAAILMLMTTNKRPPQRRRAPKRTDRGSSSKSESPSRMQAEEAAALYRLMTWLSPSFPVGAFSYSSGIEWAVEAGDITDAASLQNWLTSMLTDGAGFCDGVFLAHAHRAASAGDEIFLALIAELAAVFVPSRERQLETSTQGRAFIDVARAAWNSAWLDRMIGSCGGIIVYPVAVGIVSAAHAIPLEPVVQGFLHAVVSNWISAAARLVPLGQTECQRLLARLEPAVTATAGRALAASLDDLGSATFRADLAGMRHETQYTRLFRS
jgi:urease accessory protein